MAPRRTATYSKVTFDKYGKDKIFKPFVNFIFKSLETLPTIFLYVHDGPFGFYPVFGVRYLNHEFKNPYLIKFKEDHLDPNDYKKMIDILYSKENQKKIKKAELEKIKQSLSDYDY